MSVAVSLSEPRAIETRDGLIIEAKAELNRDDISEDEVKSAIQRFEARINRILRVPAMETVAGIDIVDGVGSLPSDWLMLRGLYDADKNLIPAVDPLAMFEARTGERKVHSIVGGQLRVGPTSTEAVTAIYYAKIPALTVNQQTNWLLDAHADIYFYGVLLALESRIGNDDRLGMWKGALDEALTELIDAGRRDRFSGPLQQRSIMKQVRGARA